MSQETTITVPLDRETKDSLSRVARRNGRAMGREAAKLIKTGLAALTRRDRRRA